MVKILLVILGVWAAGVTSVILAVFLAYVPSQIEDVRTNVAAERQAMEKSLNGHNTKISRLESNATPTNSRLENLEQANKDLQTTMGEIPAGVESLIRPSLEESSRRIDRLESRTPFHAVYESAGEMMKLVGLVEARRPVTNSPSLQAGGILINEYTFVTAGHFHTDSALTKPGSITVELDFVKGADGENPFFKLGEPELTDNGLLARYTLTCEQSQKIKNLGLSYLPIADADMLTVGDPAFLLTANPSRISFYGSPIERSYLEYTHYTESFWYEHLERTVKVTTSAYEMTLDELFSNSYGVNYAIDGDSGSPVVMYDRDTDTVYLIGTRETFQTVTRADLYEDFIRGGEDPCLTEEKSKS